MTQWPWEQGLAAVEQGRLIPRRCQCRQALVCAAAVVSQEIGSRDAHCSLRNVCVVFLAKMKFGQKVRYPHFYPSRLMYVWNGKSLACLPNPGVIDLREIIDYMVDSVTHLLVGPVIKSDFR